MVYDIIIVGAGTAGLTASIYGARAGKRVLVLEANTYGGQIINTPSIENFPATMGISGFDYATKIYEQAVSLGAEIKFEKVIDASFENGLKRIVTNASKYECKSLIIATGSKNRELGLENEKTFVGRGVSYCATCDGAFYRGNVVAVNGGGNTAFEDAIYLADIAQKVYLIHRRDEFRADAVLINQLKQKKNVEFVLNSIVTALVGDKKLSKIKVQDKSGNITELEISGLFVAIGRAPENEAFQKLVDLDKSGYIISDENLTTKTPGVFVAGDCRTKEVRQLVTAAADGAVSATQAVKFIETM